MAGDWIAMRHDLGETEEVLEIASILGRSRFEIIGMLHAVWCWFDRQSMDGHARTVTNVTLASHIDGTIACHGFAEAMQKTGWLVVGEEHSHLPNYDRWTSISAKERLLATRRKRKQRASEASRSKRDKSVTTGQDSTGEKKRDRAKPKSWRRVPPGELLTEARKLFAAGLGLQNGTAEREWAKMLDHEYPRPRTDVDAAWRNWCRNAIDFRPHRAPEPGSGFAG